MFVKDSTESHNSKKYIASEPVRIGASSRKPHLPSRLTLIRLEFSGIKRVNAFYNVVAQ